MSSPDPTVPEMKPGEALALGELRHALFGVDAPPALVGRYSILRRLGSGGMGTVYEAHDPDLDRTVAIKVLRGDLWPKGSSGRRRMKREAQSLAMLRHPNVVEVLDVGSHDGSTFIAMEFVVGVSLQEFIAAEPSRDALFTAFADAADGLGAAHAVGLVHRDFKPSNVIVDSGGRAKVLDLGLARPVNAEEPTLPGDEVAEPPSTENLTRTGAILGTPAYMAPEQWMSKADERSDQFSFCFTLHRALTGEKPFEPRAYAGSGEQPDYESRISGSRKLDGVISKGLAVDANGRHSSMAPIAEALREAAAPATSTTLGTAIAFAGIAAAATAAWALTDEPSTLCPGSDFDKAWGPSARASIGATLGGLHSDLAAAAATQVPLELDAYEARWRVAWSSACGRGEDARMICLRQRAREVEVLVQALADADETVVPHALVAVRSLPSPDACSQEVTAPEKGDAVAVLRGELAAASALLRLGRSAAALSTARASEAAIRELDDPALTVDLELALGTFALATRDAEHADQHLRAAYFGAQELGLPRRAFDAAAYLAGMFAYDRPDPKAAMDWVEHARSALGRVDGPDVLREAKFHRVLGFALWHAGQHEESIAPVLRAVHLYEAAGLAGAHPRAAAVRDLGRAFFSRGDYAAAEKWYAQALAITTEAFSEAHPSAGKAYTGLGYAAIGRGDNDASLERFEKARRILSESVGDADAATAAAEDGWALALLRADRVEEAMAPAKRVEAATKRIFGTSHPEYARALSRVAQVHSQLGQLGEARAALLRVTAIFNEVQGDTTPEALAATLELANVESELGDVEGATKRTRAVVAASKSVSPTTHVNALVLLGELQRRSGDLEAGTKTLREAKSGSAAIDPAVREQIDARLAEFQEAASQ